MDEAVEDIHRIGQIVPGADTLRHEPAERQGGKHGRRHESRQHPASPFPVRPRQECADEQRRKHKHRARARAEREGQREGCPCPAAFLARPDGAAPQRDRQAAEEHAQVFGQGDPGETPEKEDVHEQPGAPGARAEQERYLRGGYPGARGPQEGHQGEDQAIVPAGEFPEHRQHRGRKRAVVRIPQESLAGRQALGVGQVIRGVGEGQQAADQHRVARARMPSPPQREQEGGRHQDERQEREGTAPDPEGGGGRGAEKQRQQDAMAQLAATRRRRAGEQPFPGEDGKCRENPERRGEPGHGCAPLFRGSGGTRGDRGHCRTVLLQLSRAQLQSLAATAQPGGPPSGVP